MNELSKANRILIVVLLISALYVTSWYSYLLFHTLAEIFTVLVMSSVFILAWNTRRWMDNGYFLFIGVAFLFVGLIDLMHALAYRGMNVFQGYDANLPTQLWILARYIQSTSLLAAPLWLERRLPLAPAVGGFLALTLVSLWLVFSGNFPDCYVEGVGLTDFKIISEYIIILILGASAGLLLTNKARFESSVLHSLLAFLVVSIVAELAFTAYLGVYDLANLIGHLLRLVSYFFLYSALIRTGLQRPFDLVFRDLKLKAAALVRSEADLQRLFDINPFPVVITAQSNSRLLKVNQAAMELFELDPGDLGVYKGIDFYVYPGDRTGMLDRLRKEGKVQNELLELKSKSGKRIWCLINAVPLQMDDEAGLLVGIADITEQRRIQEELRYLSTHDALTGVYNRNYFEAEMNRLQKGRRFPVSIVMLDMDDLKQINDMHGHSQGDQVLQTVARLVKEILRAEEVFARIGGDEFAILLPHAESNIAHQVISRIKEQLDKQSSENGSVPIKVSIGMGIANEREDLNEAFKRADANMYADKSVRKGNTQPRNR